LADVPFEDLEVLEQKLGAARYEEVMFGSRKAEGVKEKKIKEAKSELFAENRKKKDSRPLEMSSKQRPARSRKVVKTENKVSRDPRFDDLSGKLNLEMFKKSYSFLDKIKTKEKKALKVRLKKEKNPEKKAALHKVLQKLTQREILEKEDEEKTIRNREMKKKELEAIRKGKKPFYMKKSEKKKMELAEKYKKLKESGKLNKYISKKRKRNAAKERKYLPKKRDSM